MTNSFENYPPTSEELDNNPNASDWLKRNWRMARRRDIFDATQDAAVLHDYCQALLLKNLKGTEIKKKGEGDG